MEEKRYLLLVEGRVQKVGFRTFCNLIALNRNLTGYARNLDNGMVEVEVQGKKDLLDSFIIELKKGNMFIKVEDLSIKEIPLQNKEKSFIIK